MKIILNFFTLIYIHQILLAYSFYIKSLLLIKYCRIKFQQAYIIIQNKIFKMDSFKSFFKKFDMFTAPATLRSQQQPETSSFFPGLISFITASLFFYVFISNIVSIFQYNNISSTQTETKLPGDQVSANGILFGVMINYMDWSQASKYFDVKVTAYAIDTQYNIQLQICTPDQWALLGDDYESTFNDFGLGSFICPTSTSLMNLEGTFKKSKIKFITVQIITCYKGNNNNSSNTNSTTNTTNTNNTTSNSSTNNNNTPNANTTSNSSTNNNNTSNANQTTNNTVANSTTNTNITSNSTTTNTTATINSTINTTNPNPNPPLSTVIGSSTCSNISVLQAYVEDAITKGRSMAVEIYFLDQVLNSSAKNPISYFVNNDNRVTFTAKRGVDSTIQFSSMEITTDLSFLPYTEDEVLTSTFIDNSKQSSFEITQIGMEPFVVFKLIMNAKMVYISRTLGKLDQTLSYVGGLFSIIIAFLAFFIMSYNQYRYQLLVAEGSFNYNEDGKKVRESDFHFHKYIKYGIYDWINTLFCTKLKWEDCEEIDNTREEVNCQMDVLRLFRKIRNLETALLYLMNEKQRNCLSLFEPPSLPKVRKQRLMNQYYDAIIKGEPAPTVQDIATMKTVFKMGLQDFTRRMELDYQKQLNMEGVSQAHIYQLNDTQNRGQVNEYENQIRLSEDRSNILEIALNNFPHIENQAKMVVLSEQLEQIEKQIAQSFYTMPNEVRARLQQKIPIKIIHRLKMRMNEMNAKTTFHINL